MATLNASTRGRMRTTNKCGHAAYKLDDKTKLVTMALTTMLGEPKFYGDNTDEMLKLAANLCDAGQGEFVAKLAVWARTKGNLRSVSHALMAVVSFHCSGEWFVRPAARSIASMRGDDGTEMLAAYKALFGKEVGDKGKVVRHPHAIHRGIRDALERETPYAVAKYQSRNRDMKLRDTLRITHPNAIREDTCEAMGKCVEGTLLMPKSWETELSARGNTKEVWEELIAEDKVPYFACLRNLRNIIGSGADVTPVLDKLSNLEAVRKSRLLPFRFYSAWCELAKAGMGSIAVARALDQALIAACDNVDRLPGRTAVLIDVSGSMSWAVSSKSVTTCAGIAAVLGAMAIHISDDAAVFWFANSGGIVPMTGMSVLSDVSAVPAPSGGTDMAAGFHALSATSFDADRIIVLSDNEVNRTASYWGREGGTKVIQRELDAYRRKVGHDVWCHAIDLQGYGTSQFIGDKVNIMAGWSENVLRFVSLAEQGYGGIVREVEDLRFGDSKS